jgi:hypothetical protein
MSELGEHTQIVLREMCKRVGADYEKIDFKDEINPYYFKHDWTDDDQSDFAKWMTQYLYNNEKARQEIMAVPRKTKKYCKNVANHFVFNHGWKIKNDGR